MPENLAGEGIPAESWFESEERFTRQLEEGDGCAHHELACLLMDVPGREAETEEHFWKAIHRGCPGAMNNLGRFLSRQPGRDGDAEQLLRVATAEGEKCAPGNLATLLLKRGDADLQELEELGREGVRRGDVTAHLMVGIVADRRGDHGAAHEHFVKAAEQGDPVGASNAGITAHRLGRLEEAERWYRLALSLGNTKAAGLLARFLHKVGRPEEARPLAMQAYGAGHEQGAVTLSQLARDEGDYAQRVRWLEAAVELESSWAREVLGNAYLAAGQVEKAIATAFRVLAGKDTPLNHLNLAIALLEAGRVAEAKRHLRLATELCSGVDRLAALLAESPGSRSEAELILREHLAPGHEHAAAELRRLGFDDDAAT